MGTQHGFNVSQVVLINWRFLQFRPQVFLQLSFAFWALGAQHTMCVDVSPPHLEDLGVGILLLHLFCFCILAEQGLGNLHGQRIVEASHRLGLLEGEVVLSAGIPSF